jgi:drug/metabolite transporter (DMT)-like permease
LTKVLNLKFFSRTIIFTTLAMIAFAANSVLCRMALNEEAIDPASFTSIRLISGATILLLLVYASKSKNKSSSKGSWVSGGILFIYAVTFSFAYVSLDTGTGALIAFATVQITMITSALFQGNKMNSSEWVGLILAFGGFVYLVFPGVTAPSLSGLLLMILSGMAWGIYSLRGKSSLHPLNDTAFNFLRAIPFVIILLLLSIDKIQATPHGITLAIISGALTSGIGYTIWYMALKGLSAIHASIVQLIVPVIAATGGVLFLSEIISIRLLIASILILGGISIAILTRKK